MSVLRKRGERERERGKITREATETDESLSATAGDWTSELALRSRYDTIAVSVQLPQSHVIFIT